MLHFTEGVTARGEGGRLGSVDRAFSKVENLCNAIAAFVIVIVMVYMCAEILSRKFMGRPLEGVIDWIELSMASFAFLGAAYCQRLGSHVRMELLIGRFRGRILWTMEAFAIAIALFYVLVIAYRSATQDFWWSFDQGDSTMDIYLPTWPSKLLVSIGLSVLAVRLAIQLCGYVRLMRTPDAKPIAVPLIKSAADIAREEVEEATALETSGSRAKSTKPNE